MTQGFVGRAAELALLRKRLDLVARSGRATAVAIRGRRQVRVRQRPVPQPQRTLGATPKPGAVAKQADKDVRLNFEKFLVSRKGDVVARFDPDVVPLDEIIVDAVKEQLAKKA